VQTFDLRMVLHCRWVVRGVGAKWRVLVYEISAGLGGVYSSDVYGAWGQLGEDCDPTSGVCLGEGVGRSPR